MSDSPLTWVGRWQTAEVAAEVCLPLALASGGWWLAARTLSAPVPGPPLTPMELGALLGACVALTAWATARQLHLYGRRSPRRAVLTAMAVVAAAIFTLPYVVRGRFEQGCTAREGVVVPARGLDAGAEPGRACRIGGVPDNAYLPGVLLRPAWDGRLAPAGWVGLLAVAGVGALGLRSTRLRPSTVPERLVRALRFAPAVGTGATLGSPAPKDARVQACANATLWGEPCGQLYAAEKVFRPGEWCLRCQQVFRPVDREVTFRVVSLFSGDVDVLNGLERVDTIAWRQGEPMPPDARLSAQERWVVLGTITLPDVVTVAQALAFVHEQLPRWTAASPAAQEAGELAQARASRVHAWIWQGATAARLTYARPTPDAILAVGPVRLRDLPLDGGEELTLQLDIGLLPLELRVGFRKTFLDATRPPEVQNSRQDLWIPVGPPGLSGDAAGIWVPRIEGEALRTWLSTEQARGDDVRGVSSPLPYSPREAAAAPKGTLDLVRVPLAGDGPVPAPRPGASIAEWKWLEAEQIALLRREALVLVETGGRA